MVWSEDRAQVPDFSSSPPFHSYFRSFFQRMRTLPTVLISILISNLHQVHCQDSDTSIYFEKSSEFNLVSSQEVNITSTVNPRDQSNSTLQECFPFCAEFQGTPPSVSEWEASRYEKRLGNLKYVDPIIGSAGKDPKVYDPEYSKFLKLAKSRMPDDRRRQRKLIAPDTFLENRWPHPRAIAPFCCSEVHRYDKAELCFESAVLLLR